jgi:hypothetical protein
MPDAMMPAALQDVEKTLHVGRHVGVRILQRVAHARLRREVDDRAEARPAEQRFHLPEIRDVHVDEPELRVLQPRQARFLEADIVVVVQVVDADHGLALGEEPQRRVHADEACRAGDENRCLSHRRFAGRVEFEPVNRSPEEHSWSTSDNFIEAFHHLRDLLRRCAAQSCSDSLDGECSDLADLDP